MGWNRSEEGSHTVVYNVLPHTHTREEKARVCPGQDVGYICARPAACVLPYKHMTCHHGVRHTCAARALHLQSCNFGYKLSEDDVTPGLND